MDAMFEPNVFWVAWSAFNFIFFVGFLWAVVWTMRKPRAVSRLERRVSDLEAQARAREEPNPSG